MQSAKKGNLYQSNTVSLDRFKIQYNVYKTMLSAKY